MVQLKPPCGSHRHFVLAHFVPLFASVPWGKHKRNEPPPGHAPMGDPPPATHAPLSRAGPFSARTLFFEVSAPERLRCHYPGRPASRSARTGLTSRIRLRPCLIGRKSQDHPVTSPRC